MNLSRRRFCQSAIAAGAMGTLPAREVWAMGRRRLGALPSAIPAVNLDGAAITLASSAVRALGESLRGAILLKGDFGYDGARKIWNGMHDRYPALIVRAADANDVSMAVNFAREHHLLTSVKGGGHSWPGSIGRRHGDDDRSLGDARRAGGS